MAGLPAEGQAIIVPNPAARVTGNTWEVDFIVGYRGRIGIIEVDGSTHHKRWAADQSRDRLFEDAGVARVDHIAAEDASDFAMAKKFAETFPQPTCRRSVTGAYPIRPRAVPKPGHVP